MKLPEIIALQKRVGTKPDGDWGLKSIAACQAHLRRMMPAKCWPDTDQASLTEFYGRAGDESQLVNLDVRGLGIEYEGQPVKTIRCNEKCAESLHRVLVEISKSSFAWILKKFAGCFNNRVMRGGSKPSLHARGAAIDFDPQTNGNTTHWPLAATMPIEVMEMFAKEGWLAAGAFWGRDAMHLQATC
jgi:hypothetical protein